MEPVTEIIVQAEYTKAAWIDPAGSPEWGYTVFDITEVTRTDETVERNDGYEDRLDHIWVDNKGRRFREAKNYIDYSGGGHWVPEKPEKGRTWGPVHATRRVYVLDGKPMSGADLILTLLPGPAVSGPQPDYDPSITADDVTVFFGSNRCGLYINHDLRFTGTPQEVAAHLLHLLGADVRLGDEFLCGTPDTAAPDLETVDDYRVRSNMATELRQKAADLAAEADRLLP